MNFSDQSGPRPIKISSPGPAVFGSFISGQLYWIFIHSVEFVSWLLEGLGREPDVSQVLNKVLNTVTLSLELE